MEEEILDDLGYEATLLRFCHATNESCQVELLASQAL